MKMYPTRTPTPSSSDVTSRPVLPPISTASTHQLNFSHRLQDRVDTEVSQIDPSNDLSGTQRFQVYKNAFNEVLDHVTAYRPILSAVKQEYEQCITNLEAEKREVHTITGKLKTMAAEPTTYANYRRRTTELEERMAIVISDNIRLEAEMRRLKEVEKDHERRRQQAETHSHNVAHRLRPFRAVPGLSSDELIDMDTLTDYLSTVSKQLKELEESRCSRYVTQGKYQSLQSELQSKNIAKHSVENTNSLIKHRYQKLASAIENGEGGEDDTPVLTMILRSLTQGYNSDTELECEPDSEELNVGHESETETLLTYIEQLNVLFKQQRYREAALHAANSPRGVLRNMATIEKFKAVRVYFTDKSPLLMLCEALMSTVSAVRVKPCQLMSEECVECAVNEDHIDLVTHWFALNCVTYSDRMGEILHRHCQCSDGTVCECGCIALSTLVYSHTGNTIRLAISLCLQAHIEAFIELTLNNTTFNHCDLMYILEQCPNGSLAQALVQPREGEVPLLPLGMVAHTLLKTERYPLALQMLQHIYTTYPPDCDLNGIQRCILSDKSTTHSMWVEIIRGCQDNGLYDIAIEILASVTVGNVLTTAISDAVLGNC